MMWKTENTGVLDVVTNQKDGLFIGSYYIYIMVKGIMLLLLDFGIYLQ